MFNKKLTSLSKKVRKRGARRKRGTRIKRGVRRKRGARLSFFCRNRSKMVALLFWLIVVSSYWLIANHYNLPPQVMVKQLGDWFVSSVFGRVLFILFFALQPLVFFPSALMGILGGCLYGPIEGFFITLIGANGAGLTSYMVGRFFGEGMLTNEEQNDSLMQRYAKYMRTNSFEAILIMHLIFLPYDLVNYLAGFLSIDWKSFVFATALGSLPGMLTLVLFGASIEGDLMSGTPEINLTTLALSGVTLIISLGLSQVLKQRQKHLNNTLAETS